MILLNISETTLCKVQASTDIPKAEVKTSNVVNFV